jgi:hypothetical protein
MFHYDKVKFFEGKIPAPARMNFAPGRHLPPEALPKGFGTFGSVIWGILYHACPFTSKSHRHVSFCAKMQLDYSGNYSKLVLLNKTPFNDERDEFNPERSIFQ